MARLPRLYLPGCARHVIQRGNNREACFYDEADYDAGTEPGGDTGSDKQAMGPGRRVVQDADRSQGRAAIRAVEARR